jgi:hypothetical protein
MSSASASGNCGRNQQSANAVLHRPLLNRDAHPLIRNYLGAMSLNNLSLRLAGLGRRGPALAAIEEAVAIRRSWPPDGPTLISTRLHVVDRHSLQRSRRH